MKSEELNILSYLPRSASLSEKMAQFLNFPSEMLVKIFSDLDSQTLIEVSKTCSRFQEIIMSPLIWRNKKMEVTLNNKEELESFLQLAPVFPEIESLSLTLWTDCTSEILKDFHSLTDLHLSIDVRHCPLPTFFKWNHHLLLSLKSLHLKMNSCSHNILLKFVIFSNLKSLSLEGEEPIDIGPFFYNSRFFLMKKLIQIQIKSPMFLDDILIEGLKASFLMKGYIPDLVEVLLQKRFVNSILNFEYDKNEIGIILNQRFSNGPITDF